RVMRFAEVRLQSQGKCSFGARRLLPGVSRLEKMINASAGGREPRMGERKVGIECNRLDIELLSCPIILEKGVGFEFVFLRLEVKIVGLSVLGWFGGYAGRFIRREFDLQGRCNLAAHFTIDA